MGFSSTAHTFSDIDEAALGHELRGIARDTGVSQVLVTIHQPVGSECVFHVTATQVEWNEPEE